MGRRDVEGRGPYFPGAVGISGLSVYDQPAADGLCGGSPHVHLACTEAYIVVDGEGELHTLTANGLQRTELRPGVVAWFGPGTIHRAVNQGSLRVVVVMENSGLPEAGDAVLTFPSGVLADPEAYQQAATAVDEADALRRRDLAVSGYLALADALAEGKTEALEQFYQRAAALRADLYDAWEAVWRAGARASAERTSARLAALRQGSIEHLLAAGLRAQSAPRPEHRAFGMCGRLDRYGLGAG